ncbi:hypothetical protein C0989_008973 [Termitomyces sp. Mn162]|nr:hypothetical protein C0989_008973 [Termitomyces sp. Mn162]
MAGPSGPPSGADAMQPPAGVAPSTRSKSGIRPGVVRLVPEGSRVVQAEVTPEQFAEVVGRARGPPTLKWCQVAAPELEVRTVHLQARAEAAEVAMQQAGGSGVWETQQGSSAGEVRAAAERARQREEWLANKVASGWQGVLREWFPRFRLLSADSGSTDWAQEHHILLDRASAALGSIHDGLARMPGDLPPELGQGVTQMGRLLAGHRWRAMADPRAWWEMAMDVGEPLPGQPEVLAAVVAQLEVFMVGRVAGLGSEEEGE